MIPSQSGIESIVANDVDVIENRWYSLTGTLLKAQPEAGLAIKCERLSDGTMRSTRVLSRCR